MSALELPIPERREVVVHRERFDVWNEVPLVPQTTGMSCWAAAAAMIVGWRDALAVDPEQIARGAGRWSAYVEGLIASDVDALGRAWDLVIEPNTQWTVASLREVLENYGPMWVGEASPGLHALVVTGIHGDGTPDGTHVRINDPWPIDRGERYSLSASHFLENLQRATDTVGAHAQVLRSRGRRAGTSRNLRVDETHTYRSSVFSSVPRGAAPETRITDMTNQTASELAPRRIGQPQPVMVPAGERVLQSSSFAADPLRGHLGTPDNVLVRWNAMPATTRELDVVVYLHGYSGHAPDAAMLRSKAATSGMIPSQHPRPCLVIIPRGRKITAGEYQAALRQYQTDHAAWAALPEDQRRRQREPRRPRSDAYHFPGLVTGGGRGLAQLVEGALAWLSTTILQASSPIRTSAAILAAHSGGGMWLDRLLAFRQTEPSCNPLEVYVFDALYGRARNLEAWVVDRVAADARSGLQGALRVFARGGTASNSRLVRGQIPATANAARYQVLGTSVDHDGIPGAYGPSLLRDPGFASAPRTRALQLEPAYGAPDHVEEVAEASASALALEPDDIDVGMALGDEPEAHDEAISLGLAVVMPPRVGRTMPSVEVTGTDRAIVLTTALPAPSPSRGLVASPPDDDYRAVFAWCPTPSPQITWMHFHGNGGHVIEASTGKRRPTWDNLPGPGRAGLPLDNTWDEHQYGRALGSHIVPEALQRGVLALLPECGRPDRTARGVLARPWHGQFSTPTTLRAVLDESVAQLGRATRPAGGPFLDTAYAPLGMRRLVVSAHSGGGASLLDALGSDLLQPSALRVGEREIGLDVWLFDCTYPFGAWASRVDALITAWRAAGRLGNRPGGLRFVCVDIPVEWQRDPSGALVKNKPSGTRMESDALRRTLLPKFAPDVADLRADPGDRFDPAARTPRPAFLASLDHGVVFCRTQQTEHSPLPQTVLPYLLRTAKI